MSGSTSPARVSVRPAGRLGHHGHCPSAPGQAGRGTARLWFGNWCTTALPVSSPAHLVVKQTGPADEDMFRPSSRLVVIGKMAVLSPADNVIELAIIISRG